MKLLEKTLSLIGCEKRSDNGDNYWSNFNALRVEHHRCKPLKRYRP